MAKNKNGNISIANILALMGLASIGVVVFFGTLLHSSDGKLFVAVAYAMVAIVLLALFLYLSIHAKGVEEDVKNWRYAEWGCLVAYVVVAIVFASSFNRFFYIAFENKEQLQRQARAEVEAIRTMYSEYERQTAVLLDAASEQLQNYIDSHQQSIYNQAIYEYVYGMEGIQTDIKSWKEKAELVVKLPKDEELKTISRRVENWNLLDLNGLAGDLKEKVSKAWKMVETHIADYGEEQKLIPIITGGGSTPYRLGGIAEIDLGEPVKSKLLDMLKRADGSTVGGWITYILLNLLVLLNYVVAPRCRIVGPVSGNNGGGLPL